MSSDETLYHYTNQQSFLSIIKEGKMWASNISYLNDSMEVEYGQNLLKKLLKKRKDEIVVEDEQGNKEKKNFLSVLCGFFEDGHLLKRSINFSVFVCSFSAQGNQLSQWRSYCKNGSGISIGVKLSNIKQLIRNNNSYTLEKCMYIESKQAQKVERFIDDSLKSFDDIEDKQQFDDSAVFKPGFFRLYMRLLIDAYKICSYLKHPKFYEEKEWRIIISTAKKPDIQYRPGTSMLTPYIYFPLKDKNDKLLIDHIYVGPTPHKSLSMESIKDFLASQKVSCRVDYSEIPFRG